MLIPGPTANTLLATRTIQNAFGAVNASTTMLATGDRIPFASFDPSGLITSENFRTVLAALDAEVRVAERGRAVINTADGALSEASGLLMDAEALAIANSNTAGLSDGEIAANQMEIDAIIASVDRLASTTAFNGDPLLDGATSVAIGNDSVTIANATPSSLGESVIDGETYTLSDVATGGSLDTTGRAGDALEVIRAARTAIDTNRAELGAFSGNAIDRQIDTLGVTIESVSAANSLIRDTDYAFEVSSFARVSLLADTAVAAAFILNDNRFRILDLLG